MGAVQRGVLMVVLRSRVRCLQVRQVAPSGRSILLRYGHFSSSWLREGARGAAVNGALCVLLVYMLAHLRSRQSSSGVSRGGIVRPRENPKARLWIACRA